METTIFFGLRWGGVDQPVPGHGDKQQRHEIRQHRLEGLQRQRDMQVFLPFPAMKPI